MALNNYKPNPLNTSNVTLSDDLLELTELLAKNTHEIWAQKRIAQGWKYGEKRNDKKKEHPCLVPYEDLPEYEKVYDRNTAMETLKAVKLFGFVINKQKG